jgi:hypothetical protein
MCGLFFFTAFFNTTPALAQTTGTPTGTIQKEVTLPSSFLVFSEYKLETAEKIADGTMTDAALLDSYQASVALMDTIDQSIYKKALQLRGISQEEIDEYRQGGIARSGEIAAFAGDSEKGGACDFSWFNVSITGILLCIVGTVAGAITAVGVAAGTAFIHFAMSLSATIYEPDSLANVGFDIALQLTNIVFVIALIVIAFAIMLRRSIGGRAAGGMIAQLIIVAVLINFSFLIAGGLVKTSDALTNVFIDSAAGGGIEEISKTFRDTFTNKFFAGGVADLSVDESFAGAAGNVLVKGPLMDLTAMVFAITFGIISIIVFFAVGIMFMVRYIVLTILMVLLPFALVGTILPGASGWWQNWVQNFTKWILFGPAMAFFIYLSFTVLENKVSVDVKNNMFAGFGDMFVIIGLLIGGLIASNSMGITGASAALGKLNEGKDWAIKKAKLAGVRSAKWAGQKGLTAGADPVAKKPGFVQRGATKMAGVPVVGGALGFRGISGAIDRQVAGIKADTQDRQKKFEGVSDDTLLAHANNAMNIQTLTKKAAIAAEIGKRGLVDKVSSDKLGLLVAAAGKAGVGDDILLTRPDLAPQFGKDIPSAVRKVKEGAKLSPLALQHNEVLGNLLSNHIDDIGKFGNDDQKKVLYSSLEKAMKDNTLQKVAGEEKELKQLEETIKDLAVSGSKASAEQIARKNELQKTVGELKDSLTSSQKVILQNYNKVTDNPHFANTPITNKDGNSDL